MIILPEDAEQYVSHNQGYDDIEPLCDKEGIERSSFIQGYQVFEAGFEADADKGQVEPQ